MVERRSSLGFLAHAIMILGVLLVAFPIYLAFVASTHQPQDIVQSPMPLWPGSHMWETYRTALFGGGDGAVVGVDELVDNGEADAAAADGPCTRCPIETFEDVR